jgi:predicted O-methyltransferase YrrM
MHYQAPVVDDRLLWDIWLSVHRLQTLSAAYELEIFQTLAAGPITPAKLAALSGFDLRATEVVLTMLAALGLVRARGDAYELTDVSRTYLLPDSPFDWGPLISRIGVIPDMHRALVQVLRGTKNVSRPATAWAQGRMSPELAASVSRVMHCHSLPAAIELARMPELRGVRRLLDVGGGSGVFSIALAQQHPALRCTVMELEAVCEVARGYIRDGDVGDRVDSAAVDMFRDHWPEGYDAVLVSNVFHDWSAETNAQLARSAFGALPAGGKILVHEMLVDDAGGLPTTAGFSVRMLTTNEGKQYSLAELTALLEAAGFVDIRESKAHLYYSLVIGTKT